MRIVILISLVFYTVNGATQSDKNDMHHHHHMEHHGHEMIFNSSGMVMNSNHETLPEGCSSISKDYEFTIRAGTKYSSEFPGKIFGMSQHEIKVKPCSRLTVTFVNEDTIRHQWMVHGLPKYLYPGGMMHIEAVGGATMTGTFIVPADDRTYLIHCDMSQHMEKGMKGQLVVGKGSGNLWNVDGVSDAFFRYHYLPSISALLWFIVLLLSMFITVLLLKYFD